MATGKGGGGGGQGLILKCLKMFNRLENIIRNNIFVRV